MSKKIIVVSFNDSMIEAYKIMRKYDIRHLLVQDHQEQIVGILSDRDVQRAMTVKIENGIQQDVSISPEKRVEDFMSWPVEMISSNSLINQAVLKMLNKKISAVAVRNEQGIVEGILTSDDLLAYLLNLMEQNSEFHMRPVSILMSKGEII